MKKLNIAELLKDCPKGMELDCAMYDGVEFMKVDTESDTIILRVGNKFIRRLNKYGQDDNVDYAKCVIFPKGKTTWEGFVPPCQFKDGDIVVVENACGIHIFIYNHTTGEYNNYGYYVIFTSLGKFKINGFCSGSTYRFATEEEKQKLFNAIKANGYKWNAETKTLEKLIVPKFKVGDRVKKNEDYISGIVTNIYDDSFKVTYAGGGCSYVQLHYQHEWELVPNKFDITTLTPFESKVLVREDKTDVWRPAFYGFFNQQSKRFYNINSSTWLMCIPYNEDTKHLTGTTNDCDEYYKTW